MKFIIAISSLLILVSCNKKVDEESISVNAIVFNTSDLNCGMPVLNFSDDSTKVRAFTGNSAFTYVVYGFPSELNTTGKRVLVQIAILTPENYFPCLTFGPSWPALKVLTAKTK
jgi:hypothetical protein